MADLPPLPPHIEARLADLQPVAVATADALARALGESPEAWRGVDVVSVQVAAAILAGSIIGDAAALQALAEVVTALAAHPAARAARVGRSTPTEP